jgi:hypothetical protein
LRNVALKEGLEELAAPGDATIRLRFSAVRTRVRSAFRSIMPEY